CALVWPSAVLKEIAESEYPEMGDRRGHGGEPMTSLLRAIAPDSLRMDLCKPGELSSLGDFSVVNSQKARFSGHSVNLMLDLSEVSDSGTTGDGRQASAETGKLLLDRLVTWGVDLVAAFKRLPT